MKIGLMGFEFESANKGCEALVYSFVSILAEDFKETITIYNFSGTSLGIIEETFPMIKFINVMPKMKDLKCRYIKALAACDYIFDVTMGDSFSDIYSLPYYNYLIKNKRIAELLCKKYILLPQTYGPFNHKESEKKAKRVFKNASVIYCRDELSQQLLKDKFNIIDSILVSDMAFILPYEKNKYLMSSREKIGINISGLLYKGGFNKTNQFGLILNYPEFIERIIGRLISEYEVHLIPHVIDQQDEAYDDDFKICEKLNEKFPNTILAPAFGTPIEAKSYISNMDIFIGSRMHSTIAAFSSGVATIPVSYSRKFEGLFGSLEYPFLINAKETETEAAIDLVMKYINDKSALASVQAKSMEIIHSKNISFKTSILKLLEDR